MKKNSFLILGLTLVLCTATPFSVYAQDINGDDLVMMQETDFEKMIGEILSIKSENPELTEARANLKNAIEEARKQIKQGSLAHSFLERYLKKQQ